MGQCRGGDDKVMGSNDDTSTPQIRPKPRMGSCDWQVHRNHGNQREDPFDECLPAPPPQGCICPVNAMEEL